MDKRRGNPFRCPECGRGGGRKYSGYCPPCYRRVSNEESTLYINRPVYPGYGIKVNNGPFISQKEGSKEDYGYIQKEYGYQRREYT